MNQQLRIVLAFAFAPLVPVSYFCSTLGFGKIVLISVPVYLITFLVALPIYVLMTSRGWLSWWHFCLFALVPALSFDLAIYAYYFVASSETSNFNFIVGETYLVRDGSYTFEGYMHVLSRLLVYAAVGVVTGFLFWFIAYVSFSSKKSNQSDPQNPRAIV